MHTWLQVGVNGLAEAALYFVVGGCFTFAFGTMKFLDLALALWISLGACVWVACLSLAPPALALGLAVVVTAIAGGAAYGGVYYPLKMRGASHEMLFLASLGLLVLGQNLLSLLFGDRILVPDLETRGILSFFFGVRVSLSQACFLVGGALVGSSYIVFTQYTGAGRLITAIHNDEELASIYGVDVGRITFLVYLVTAVLGALAGAVLALDTGAVPRLGFEILLFGVIAAMLGGLGSMSGAFFGAIVVGVTGEVVAMLFAREWSQAAVLALMTLLLLVRRRHLGKEIWPGGRK